MTTVRLCSCLIVLCVAAGCQSSRQVDALQSELRAQESELYRLSSLLEETEASLAATRADSDRLRAQLTGDGQSVIPAEQAELFYRISDFQIDTMQSSFVPNESGPGGQFTVLVTPIDEFAAPIRLPGQITVKIYPNPHAETPLAEKTFSAAEVRELWTSGWVSSGFLLQFPWQPEAGQIDQPLSDRVIIVADFETADQRQFAGDAELAIRSPRSPGQPEKRSVALATQQETATMKAAKPANLLPPLPDARPVPDAPPTQHSDRRTIDEFPVYR